MAREMGIIKSLTLLSCGLLSREISAQCTLLLRLWDHNIRYQSQSQA